MQESASEIEAPHPKRQMPTAIGRLIDEASYFTIVALFIEVLWLSALYIQIASAYWPGHGVVPTNDTILSKTIEFSDAFYFCVVTFTTTGYGDYVPQGFARVVASFVVLFGLTMATVLIGKAASERQNSILLLLYTSDCQRRLADFCRDLEVQVKILRNANGRGDLAWVNRSSREIANILELVSRYTMFHANQGKLAVFGNESALSALYENFLRVEQTCSETFYRWEDEPEIRRRAFAIVGRTVRYTKILMEIQRNAHLWRMPFHWLLPSKFRESVDRFFLCGSAAGKIMDRDARVLDTMLQLEKALGTFVKKRHITHLGSPPVISAELDALLQCVPDRKLVLEEIRYWRRAKGLPHRAAGTYERFLAGFTGTLAKTVVKVERACFQADPDVALSRVLTAFAFELKTWTRKTPSPDERFPLTVSDRRLVILQWLLYIKRVQVALERVGGEHRAPEGLAASIGDINRMLRGFSETLAVDLKRRRLRRQVLCLIAPRLNRSRTRDIVLAATCREIWHNAKRIDVTFQAS